MYHISNLQEYLFAKGRPMSPERIRRYEKQGIIPCSREKGTKYRIFDEKQFKMAIRNITLLQLGCPVNYIKSGGYELEHYIEVLNECMELINKE